MAPSKVTSDGKRKVVGHEPGVILYPALGNPELVSGDDSLHLILCLAVEPSKMKGEAGQKILAAGLKFMSLESAENFKLQRLGANDFHGALNPSLVKSIESLSAFFSQDPPVVDIAKKRWQAIFKTSIVRYFSSGTLHGYSDERLQKAGLQNAYHVEMDGPVLRNWLSENAGEELAQHCFVTWMSKPPEEGFREIEEEAVTNGLREVQLGGKNKFIGARVRSACDHFVLDNDDTLVGPDGPLRVFDIFQWQFSLYHPLATLHPVFFYDDDVCLNVGYISDLHVVSRLEILRRSDFQMVPGVHPDYSPKVSDLISTTGRAVKELLDKAGTAGTAGDTQDGEVDVLVVGGDLIDFAQSSFPGADSLAEVLPAQKVRDLVNADENSLDRLYDYGVDLMAIYELIVDFYRTYQKPVVILSGNHDAYDAPFGVSPRIVLKSKMGNPGIPADANLTVAEACLLYGDNYDKHFFSIGDFNADVMDCFYLVFTPVLSFTAKMGKMQWISLGWGDDENMFTEGPSIGHLPNANDSVSASESTLIDQAVKYAQDHGVTGLMVSHFTWASFDDALRQDPKRVGYFPWGNPADLLTPNDVTKYNLGTCELNRKKVYEHLYNGRIHAAISGHSHRAGLYQIDSLHYVGDRVSVTSRGMDDFQAKKDSVDAPYIIVSDSSGPLPRENVEPVAVQDEDGFAAGAFNGWGSHAPSFTKLTFDSMGELTDLRRVWTTQPRTKPRLAVAMDYYELENQPTLGNDFWLKDITTLKPITMDGVDQMKRDANGKIPLHLHWFKDHIPAWIGVASATLHFRTHPPRAPGFYTFRIFYAGNSWILDDPDFTLLDLQDDFSVTGFLSIILGTYHDKTAGSSVDRYNISSPWVVAVNIKVTAAAPGFLGLTTNDFKLKISRVWDFVKYPAQSAYVKLLPSSGGEPVSTPEGGADSPGRGAGATPSNGSQGVGDDSGSRPDPGFQIKIPLPF